MAQQGHNEGASDAEGAQVCRQRGCPWRGRCPEHGVSRGYDRGLERLMSQRPHNADAKRQRQPARYKPRYRVGTNSVVTRSLDDALT